MHTSPSHTHTHTHTQNQLLGPGTYSTETGDFTPRAIEQKRGGPNWERAHEVARLAAIPHMLYRQQWEHKRLLVGHASCSGSTRGYWWVVPRAVGAQEATGGSCLVQWEHKRLLVGHALCSGSTRGYWWVMPRAVGAQEATGGSCLVQWEHKRLLVGHASCSGSTRGYWWVMPRAVGAQEATGGSCLVHWEHKRLLVGHASFLAPQPPWRGLGTRLLVDTACNQDSAMLELTNKRNACVYVETNSVLSPHSPPHTNSITQHSKCIHWVAIL